MLRFRSLLAVLLIHVCFLSIEINSSLTMCNICKTLLSKNDHTPNCTNPAAQTCGKEYVCGVTAMWIKQGGQVAYCEGCMHRQVCTKLKSLCREGDCFYYCCDEGNMCNKYERVPPQRDIKGGIGSIMTKHAKEIVDPEFFRKLMQLPPTPIKTLPTTSSMATTTSSSTTPSSMASLLKCSEILLFLVLMVFVKNHI